MPLNRGSQFKANVPDLNLMSFLKALASIISKYRDANASYFAFHTVLNLVYHTNLLAPTVNGKSKRSLNLATKGPINLA